VSRPIKVLVVDDHRLLAEALEVLLAGEEGLEAIGSAGTADQALELCRRGCPDVVLMDLDLPGANGIEATARMLELCPDARVVVISALHDQDLLASAIRAGACGFVPKTRAADELVSVVRRAAAGEIVLPSDDIAGILWRLKDARQLQLDVDRRFALLTTREIEVLQGLRRGPVDPRGRGVSVHQPEDRSESRGPRPLQAPRALQARRGGPGPSSRHHPVGASVGDDAGHLVTSDYSNAGIFPMPPPLCLRTITCTTPGGQRFVSASN
jgi:NarL family two-component system response regulator LiaR